MRLWIKRVFSEVFEIARSIIQFLTYNLEWDGLHILSFDPNCFVRLLPALVQCRISSLNVDVAATTKLV